MERRGTTTRESLLKNVRKKDGSNWEDHCRQFHDIYKTIVFMQGKSYRFCDADINELLSRVLVKFFNNEKFVYTPEKGRFRDYFRRMVSNAAKDIIRERRNDLSLDHPDSPDFDGPDTSGDDDFDANWRAAIFDMAWEEVRSEMPVRAIQSFVMCKRNGEPVTDVAKFLKVGKATVYNDCNAVWSELRKAVKRLADRN